MSSTLTLEPVLEADEIQGNVLAGFNKDFQRFIFFRISVDADIGLVRVWLRECVDRLTWLREVCSFKNDFRALAKGLPGACPQSLASTWMNIALSHPALLRFTAEASLFEPVFRDGMSSAVGRLGDPTDPATRGHLSKWIFGSAENVPDILLIIASDQEEDADERLSSERVLAQRAGLQEMHLDYGVDPGRADGGGPSLCGHEHFGFKDGISQPAVRGRLSERENDFLTPRIQTSPAEGTTIEYASPGRPLVCPGEFVLGYPRQSVASGREAAEPWPLGESVETGLLAKASSGPAWAKNGSFLVYRRLNQDVPAFNRFLRKSSEQLAALPSLAGLTPERFGAMVIGRWRSGAPLLRATKSDNNALATTKGSNNDFDFLVDGSMSDGFPAAVSDPAGEICPGASHIRKVNPRALGTDQGGEVNTLVRRILRRGIPFGSPLPVGIEADSSGMERGLLFLCYQASIPSQFEFLQSFWANDDSKPTPQLTGRAGQDLVIGQGRGAQRSRSILVGTDQTQVDAPTGVEWVYPTAGGYFFSPSRSALVNVLGAQVST